MGRSLPPRTRLPVLTRSGRATPLVGLAARLTGSGPVDPGTPKARTQPRAEADARLETRTRRERLLPRGWGRSGLRPLLIIGGGALAWGGRGSGLLSPNRYSERAGSPEPHRGGFMCLQGHLGNLEGGE